MHNQTFTKYDAKRKNNNKRMDTYARSGR